ncbi:Sac2 family-domain-containing protein [Chytriomyces sp. MP71]|nr:Sac2 family-domain-containing protein [Chytriomyces sp. MP71]
MELVILDSLLGDTETLPPLPTQGSPNRGNAPLSLVDVDSSIHKFSEDAMVSAALASGIDLREYAENVATDLKKVHASHVSDYVAKSSLLRDLEKQIKDCDFMLASMVSLLEGFQLDLNTISAEIRDLQEKSNIMSLKLKNRTTAQELLAKVLDGLVITPDLIKKICEGEVNEFFLAHLLELNKKMAYVKNQKGAHIRALKDVGPELERLRLKASEKIREFYLKKVESLKTPNTNISIIQQNHLLKFKELYWFLLERYSEAAQEVRACYGVAVQQYYHASFEKYVRSLGNLQTIIADKSDLIGSAESQGGSAMLLGGLFGSTKGHLKDRSNVYSLGDRVQVLTTEDAGIVLAHIAEEQKLKFPYEVLFKSINRLLMDNASSEYMFTTEFFFSPWRRGAKVTGSASDPTTVGAVFFEIYEPTLKFLQGALKQYIDNSYDAVGILLCIRLNSFHLRIMQKRRIPCLENFMNLLNILLWPRFQAIIDLHIESLRKIGKVSTHKDAHPHFITRRYAEFAASVLALNDGFDDALLVNSLVRLRNEVESLLFRMTDELPQRKDKLILLINNHDLVASVLNEYNLPCFEEEKAYFASSLETKTGEFVEEELKNAFGFLMEFVDRAELEKNLDTLDTGRFEAIASQFNNQWKQGIAQVNTSILQSFPNFQNGARILHAAFTLLLLFYKRFITVFEKRFVGKGRKVHPVGLQTVLFEIKKNQPNF